MMQKGTDKERRKIIAIVKADIKFNGMIKMRCRKKKKIMTVYGNGSFQDFTFTQILKKQKQINQQRILPSKGNLQEV
jgi:hypothetical protein